MKVEYSNKKRTTFSEIYKGDVFLDDDYKNIWFKIDDCYDDHGGAINACSPEDGTLIYFDPNDLITKVDAKLIVD